MTLFFMDGFDHYSNAQKFEKSLESEFISSFDSSYGRFGTGGFRLTSSNYHGTINSKINKSTIYLGIAVKKTEGGSPAYSSIYPFIEFYDDSDVIQVKFHVNSTFGISIYDASDSLLGSSADAVFPDMKWFYLECKVTISDTVGEVTVRINGTQVLNLTSQDTKNGSDYIRKIRFRCVNNGKDTYFDDMYIDDAQFHGDCRIRIFMPDSDGNSVDFTRSGGSNDYECVDESPSNDDTDYIVSDTLNHKSIFGITTGALGTVKAIQVNNHCRIDEAGTRKITPIIRSNSTDYQGTETEDITADYLFESEIFETDPDDSNPWTQTKLEAAEFGLEITT
jgi:hypothetical protein